MYIKTGFEALTGTSKSRESAGNLRALFEQLPGTSTSDSDLLVWSPAETERHPHTWKGKTENLTDLEDWFMAFVFARNEIIHDGVAASLKYQTPGTNDAGDFSRRGRVCATRGHKSGASHARLPGPLAIGHFIERWAAMKAAEAQEGVER